MGRSAVATPLQAATTPGDAALSALLVTPTGSIAGEADRELLADCSAAGIPVLGATACDNLVREVVRLGPGLVLCRDATRLPALFEQCELLAKVLPTPLLVFTPDPDPERMAQAVAAGIHVYAVQGYAPARMRALAQLARARFAHEQRLRGRLDDLTHRLEERKLIDRAKAVLMRARGLAEEDAFRVLRTTAMHTNQRIGQVAGHVIEAARSAEAVNLAGRLRMLSQRIVKQCALAAVPVGHGSVRGSAQASAEEVEANLAALASSVPRASFGNLLDAVAGAWRTLHGALGAPPSLAALPALDVLAEDLLLHAGRLTDALESAGLVTRLRVVNVSGRQRMLAQRVAKASLLAALVSARAGAPAETERRQAIVEFQAGLAYLRSAPLGGRETMAALDEAGDAWQRLLVACDQATTPSGQAALDDASETLLAMFDRLTAGYQHSMNVLMG
jgi:AmiR/NasT family two-component response regulator